MIIGIVLQTTGICKNILSLRYYIENGRFLMRIDAAAVAMGSGTERHNVSITLGSGSGSVRAYISDIPGL